MKTLARVLEIEKEEILEWLHEYDTLELLPLKIVTLRWKDYQITWHGDYIYTVSSNSDVWRFGSWEECLTFIIEEVKKQFG